jgi:hypothetical protein
MFVTYATRLARPWTANCAMSFQPRNSECASSVLPRVTPTNSEGSGPKLWLPVRFHVVVNTATSKYPSDVRDRDQSIVEFGYASGRQVHLDLGDEIKRYCLCVAVHERHHEDLPLDSPVTFHICKAVRPSASSRGDNPQPNQHNPKIG